MGVLKVKVNGTWEEAFVPEPPMDEVWTGSTSPDPAGTYELWYDTSTEPGVLKAKRENGAWEPVGTPDEVWVSPDEPVDTALELWVDTDDDNGLSSDEIWVGPTDPDIIEPGSEREMWYDTDEIAPPGVSLGVTWWDTTLAYLAGTNVAWPQADPAVWSATRDTVIGEEPGVVADAWTLVAGLNGPYVPLSDGMLKAQVHAHHIYGAVTTSPWTWTLKAGTYLSSFQCSCVASVAGIRYANLNMNGVQVAQSKHWFNELNIHHQMNQGVSVLTVPADGDYTFDITMSASAAMDANDFGHYTLIPCEPGAVS